MVHFAIFVIGCLSMSCRLETTWTGRIQGDGHDERLLPVYIQFSLAYVMSKQIYEINEVMTFERLR
jgi:hypothetical protein